MPVKKQSGLTNFTIRTILFFMGIAGFFVSAILTIGAILFNAKFPEFNTGWHLYASYEWQYLAKAAAGFMVTAVQATALIMFRRSGHQWQHPYSIACLSIFSLGTILSCFITITTFYAGMQQGQIDATHTSKEYVALDSERDRLTKKLDDLAEQKNVMVKKYTDINYMKEARKAAAEFDGQIAIFEGKLRIVNDKIENFDSTAGSKVISITKTYRSVADDIGKLFGLSKNDIDVIVILLTFFFVCSIAATVDGGAALMMYFSVGDGMEKQKEKSAKINEIDGGEHLRKLLDKNPKDLQLHELEQVLPHRPYITDEINDLNMCIKVSAGTGSGKTELLRNIFAAMVKRKQMSSKTCRLIIIDTKPWEDDKWPEWAEVYGSNMNYLDAINGLKKGFAEFKQRGKLEKKQRIALKPIYILIEELNDTALHADEDHGIDIGPLYLPYLTYTRELKMFLISCMQLEDAESTKTKGKTGVKKGYVVNLELMHTKVGKQMRWCLLKMTGFKPVLYRVPPMLGSGPIAQTQTKIKAIGHQFSKLLPGVRHHLRTGVQSGVDWDTSSDTRENQFSTPGHQPQFTDNIVDVDFEEPLKDTSSLVSHRFYKNGNNGGNGGENGFFDTSNDTSNTTQNLIENGKKTTPGSTSERTGSLDEDTSSDTTYDTSSDEQKEAEILTQIYEGVDGETETEIIRLYKTKGSINKVCKAKWGKKTKARSKNVKAVLWANKYIDLNANPINGNGAGKGV